MFFRILVSAVAMTYGCGASSPRQAQPGATRCVIDMGSNTFRLIVGSFRDGRYEQQRIDKRTLGVGDDVERHGRITDGKLTEIDATLADFKAGCQSDGRGDVAAIGTAAFRAAANADRVVTMAANRGIRMEVASEQRESQLAYLVGSLGADEYAVIDNGSRSIELVAQEAGVLRYSVVNLGYRVAFDQFFAGATDGQVAAGAFGDRLRQAASSAGFMRGRSKLVGVEFGEMAEVLFDSAKVEGRVFTLAELQQRLREITSGPAGAFEALKRKKDIDRALPRLVVAATLMEAFGYGEFVLTERELGTGLIIEAGINKRTAD
jgi:exopolyphosphatase/pppGpp-phosphohydrolase